MLVFWGFVAQNFMYAADL